MEKRAMYSMGIMPMEEDNVKKKKRLGLGKLEPVFYGSLSNRVGE